jgi:hypothetical protein
MMGLQTGMGKIFRHPVPGLLNLRLQPWVFTDETTEGALKLGRENLFVHGSFGGAQAGNNAPG